MDFVAKKAVGAKLKRFGNDLGLNDVFGESSTEPQRNGIGSVFGGSSGERQDDLESAGEVFPTAAAAYFDNVPKNFPPFLNLFFVDRSILAFEASNTITWAFRLLVVISCLLLFNVIAGIVNTVLTGGKHWVDLLLAVLVDFLLVVFQLYAFDVAFRGAYRTNSMLRRNYLIMCVVTLVICFLYAFVGAVWFNGWTRLGQGGSSEGTNEGNSSSSRGHTTRSVMAGFEATGWSLSLFLVIFTLFEYYHLWQNEHEGLSSVALRQVRANTNEPNDVEPSEESNVARSHGRDDGRRARLEEIRNKYREPVL